MLIKYNISIYYQFLHQFNKFTRVRNQIERFKCFKNKLKSGIDLLDSTKKMGINSQLSKNKIVSIYHMS